MPCAVPPRMTSLPPLLGQPDNLLAVKRFTIPAKFLDLAILNVPILQTPRVESRYSPLEPVHRLARFFDGINLCPSAIGIFQPSEMDLAAAEPRVQREQRLAQLPADGTASHDLCRSTSTPISPLTLFPMVPFLKHAPLPFRITIWIAAIICDIAPIGCPCLLAHTTPRSDAAIAGFRARECSCAITPICPLTIFAERSVFYYTPLTPFIMIWIAAKIGDIDPILCP
mmetsp:Transcript_98935/g.248094  ORF Transcript_98935/g.248094 Transcript_98935/m.248094 type:complete len:227 (-) Transcript_98935:922-1602(-)